jgi:hypothetical protein
LNINGATDADFQPATERVYRSPSMPSLLKVLTLPHAPQP